ncbi:MAG: DNA polymerase IV [Ignavibacteriaceae bacterium]|nr:DNA polymerase IV [Ignavibacteriaceae bacterium]MCK6613098.1 DNA polymerase IV [Ignavibacteriaceae bacterium]
MIFHLDLDAFFVSVERILDPSLNDKPVIVGGDPHGRGVVAACSYEARKFGLHSAMPIRQAYRLCPQGIYIHGHHEEYSRYSGLVKEILQRYAPILEQASVDEFYMDFSGCGKIYGSLFKLATELQAVIKKETGLPCSIGIGANKTIAKIASDFNKPAGITFVIKGREKEFLHPLPVEVIPGVGKKFLAQLNARAIYKIGDVLKLPLDFITSSFGKAGMDLWEKAQGRGNTILTVEREQKSISKEVTLSNDSSDKKELIKVLFMLTGRVCQTLRDQFSLASTISVKIRYSDFETVLRSHTIKSTDDDQTVFETAKELFENAYQRRVALRLIGIKLSNFTSSGRQEQLFEEVQEKRDKLIEAVNVLREKYGYSTLKLGITTDSEITKRFNKD